MSGSSEAREAVRAIVSHCRKKLHTRGTVERTAHRERIVTGILVSDPRWMTNGYYMFAITRYASGHEVWRHRVRVTPDLNISIDGEPPDEVAGCVVAGIDEFHDKLQEEQPWRRA